MLWSMFGLVPAALFLSLSPVTGPGQRAQTEGSWRSGQSRWRFSWLPLIPDDDIMVQLISSGLPHLFEGLSTDSTSIIPRTICYSADKVPTDSFIYFSYVVYMLLHCIAWYLDGTLVTVLWLDTPECWAPVISTRVKPPPPAPGLTRASGNYVNTGLITPLHCITRHYMPITRSLCSRDWVRSDNLSSQWSH